MVRERQASFSGGELSPTLWGRTDIDRYPVGARTLRNFIVTQHGVLANRPGCVLVSSFPGVVADAADAVRLLRFDISATEAALLMFSARGHGEPAKLRAFERDASTGELAEVWSTVLSEEPAGLRILRFAQAGDVVTVVGGNFEPLEIVRNGPGDYTASTLSFDVPTYPQTGFGAAVIDGYRLPLAGHTPDHPAREWKIAVTRIMRRPDGRLYETTPYVITQAFDPGATPTHYAAPADIAIYPDWAMHLTLDDGYNQLAIPDGSDGWVGSRIYRGRNGSYGYIGETTGVRFIDDGAEPDYSKPPPQGINPFKVYDLDGILVRTEIPQTVTFFEGRRYFGGTADRPTTVWGSAVNDYTNFDEVILAREDNALSFALSSLRRETIQAIIPKRQLLVLTTAAEWLISGAGLGELITPLSIAAHPITEHGSGILAPVAAANTLFHTLHKGVTPQAMVFGADGASYQSVDVALLSRHLFDGHTILDWAYARDPYSILWVARDDGKLLSLTYSQEQQVAAWAQHDLADSGAVEAVATVPYGNEDQVYMVVRRGTVRSLERLASRVAADLDTRDAIFLDRCVSYSGYDVVAISIGQTIAITDDYSTGGGVDTDVLVTFSGSFGPGFVIQVNDPAGGSPVRLYLKSAVTGSSCVATVLTTDMPASLWGVTVSDWALCTHDMHGLEHLNGLTASAVVDGGVIEDLTVNAGAVTFGDSLDDYYAIVHVGRPYDSDFRSLAAINERGKQKIVKEVTLETYGVGGGLIGPGLDQLTEVRARTVADDYGAPVFRRNEIRMPVSGQWASTGYVAYRQDKPLPVTILGITRDIEYGG